MKVKLIALLITMSSASLLFATSGRSQDLQKTRVMLSLDHASLYEAMMQIERQTDFRFTYKEEDIKIYSDLKMAKGRRSVKAALDILLHNTHIVYEQVGNYLVLKGIRPLQTDLSDPVLLVVTGTVSDENGQPLPGVNIIEKGTTNGTSTDSEGKFSLGVEDESSVLVISFIGYKTQEITVGGQTDFSINLQQDVSALEEVVVVGYGTQKKATLTGAVSSVSNEEIITTKNENAQNMLTGKIPGVRVTQKTAEPGAFNNNFDVRAMGSPLVVIDGIPRSMDVFQRLDPNDIDNISVLKDASAAIYGVRAANGVVLVTTKKGSNNKIELNYSGSFTWQIPSGLPATVDAIDYMTLRNERAMHNVNGGTPLFNEQQFEDYRSGEKQSTD